ncbi:phenylalanine--tRNA ligase subunit alpha [Patescibacteria group bacterium]|nr:phenylalanine--tRNA ligase subunit alpha [Patescibacteria group bacterium]
MINKIEAIKKKAIEEIDKAKNIELLAKIWRKYFGRKNGELSNILRDIKNIPKNRRKEVGSFANKSKLIIENNIASKKQELSLSTKSSLIDKIDITLPGKNIDFGHLHPITQIRRKVSEIFSSMGFEILEGYELETDYYNFEALNIPAGHPARDMWDTFWLSEDKNSKKKDKFLLRTHTSPMQARVMEKKDPPLRVIVPGRCFRPEATDASHEHTFYQLEGFVVDEDITISNLIYTLRSFLSSLFKESIEVRLRPGYFPFVEPGFELDFQCVFCKGRGCSVCKKTGWVELIPCGMIHPKVFEHAGYKKGKYTGFAFGAGLDRVVMMKARIDDIRWFHKGDLRFIKQF